VRILQIIPSMGGGGAERQLSYLSTELVKHDCELHVAFLYAGPNLERLEKSGAKIHWLKSRSNYDPLLLVRIIGLIRRLRPDIVQTWLPQMDVFGGMAAVICDVPFIVSERSCALAYTEGWKNHLRRIVATKAIQVIANSNGGRDYWLSKGKGHDFLSVVRNAIPFDEIDRVSEYYHSKNKSANMGRIIFAGRYSYEKNLPLMLEAIKQVLAVRPEITAYLYGEGPMREDLLTFRDSCSLSNRLFIGGYTTELWGILKGADVFVSVSTFEGTPNTVLEAAACGTPLVVSDIPAHREFLDDDSAIFVKVDSPEAVAEGIQHVLADRSTALIRAARAKEMIAHRAPAAVAAEYLKIYDRLVKQGGCERRFRIF
jgi:glycosyltransferase involved in cell wall biosynthesis